MSVTGYFLYNYNNVKKVDFVIRECQGYNYLGVNS